MVNVIAIESDQNEFVARVGNVDWKQFRDMTDWLEGGTRLIGYFMVEVHMITCFNRITRAQGVAVRFYSEDDAILFMLTWQGKL